MRIAGASRSLELGVGTSTQASTEAPSSGQAVAWMTSAPPTSTSPFRRPSALNTSLVATGMRGLTITHGIFGRLSGSSVSPTPAMTQEREDRQTRTAAPARFAPAPPPRQPHPRAGSRRPAADPGCDGQHLLEVELAELEIGYTLPEQLRGL